MRRRLVKVSPVIVALFVIVVGCGQLGKQRNNDSAKHDEHVSDIAEAEEARLKGEDKEPDRDGLDARNPNSKELRLEASNGLIDPLSPQAGNNYEARNLVDGNLRTAWAVKLSESGYESGDYLWGPTLELEASRVDGIEIVNGYAKNKTSFANNTRASWIMIYRPVPPDTGDPLPEDIVYAGPLKDSMSPQGFRVSPEYDNSRPTTNLVMTFSNKDNDCYYHGNKWDDLVISEIKVFGAP